MITSDAVGLIKSRLRTLAGAAAPKAVLAEMVIRSGDQMFLRAPLRSSLGAADKTRLLKRFDPSSADLSEGDDDDTPPPASADPWNQSAKRLALAPIVAEFGYDIVLKDFGEEKFQNFLGTYEPKMADLAPKGVRYRGTYVVNNATEKSSGDYRTIWTFRSVAALNRIGTAVKASGGINDFGGLMQKFKSHVDDSPGAGRSQAVYQVAWGTVRGF